MTELERPAMIWAERVEALKKAARARMKAHRRRWTNQCANADEVCEDAAYTPVPIIALCECHATEVQEQQVDFDLTTPEVLLQEPRHVAEQDRDLTSLLKHDPVAVRIALCECHATEVQEQQVDFERTSPEVLLQEPRHVVKQDRDLTSPSQASPSGCQTCEGGRSEAEVRRQEKSGHSQEAYQRVHRKFCKCWSEARWIGFKGRRFFKV
ncbi:hypothetical protein MTO96_020488 [Rhipicephalus appendiculatus]